jgi:hypothetical protein
VEARLDDIAKLLGLLVMRDRPLQEAIGDMDAVGIPQVRIAEIVGRTQGYVNVAAERAKKKSAPKAKEGRQAPEE